MFQTNNDSYQFLFYYLPPTTVLINKYTRLFDMAIIIFLTFYDGKIMDSQIKYIIIINY